MAIEQKVRGICPTCCFRYDETEAKCSICNQALRMVSYSICLDCGDEWNSEDFARCPICTQPPKAVRQEPLLNQKCPKCGNLYTEEYEICIRDFTALKPTEDSG